MQAIPLQMVIWLLLNKLSQQNFSLLGLALL